VTFIYVTKCIHCLLSSSFICFPKRFVFGHLQVVLFTESNSDPPKRNWQSPCSIHVHTRTHTLYIHTHTAFWEADEILRVIELNNSKHFLNLSLSEFKNGTYFYMPASVRNTWIFKHLQMIYYVQLCYDFVTDCSVLLIGSAGDMKLGQ